MSKQLSALIPKIHEFSRRYYANRLVKGLLLGLLMLLVLVMALSGLEYLLWLPESGRLVLFIIYLSGLAWIIGYLIIWPLYQLLFFRKQMSQTQAARLIGQHFTEIDDKLLNTLQLENMALSDKQSDLLAATISHRSNELGRYRFAEAIDFKSSLKFLPYFLLAVIVFFTVFILKPDFYVESGNRIARYNQAFIKPLPYQVILPEDSLTAMQNDDFSFSIKVEGDEIPAAFYVATNGGKLLMERESVNQFNYTFKKVGRNIPFHIEGGAYQSKPLTLHIFPKPVILAYEAHIVPPAYTRLDPNTEKSKSSFYVAEGSQVSIDVYVRDTDDMKIYRSDSTSETLVKEDNRWNYDFQLLTNEKLVIHSSNKWSPADEVFELNLKMIADAFPEIVAEMVTEDLGRNFYFSGGVTDDYGFSKLHFFYTIIDPETNEASREFQQDIYLEKDRIRQTFFHAFFADSANLAPGDRVEAYFRIWDNDAVNGPKSAKSKPFTLAIPGIRELDSLAQDREKGLNEKLEETKNATDQIKKDLEKLMKELALKQEADWQDKKRLEDLLERQEKLKNDWMEMREEQKKLNEFQKENSLMDEDLLRKQEQINELFDEVVSDEMKKIMEEIQKMMEELSKDDMQQMLQEMKKENFKMEDLLDRNLNLLKQLKVEKDMRDLIEELNKLGDELQKEEPDAEQSDSTDNSLQEEQEAFGDMQKKLDSIRQKNEELSKPLQLEETDSIEEEIKEELDSAEEQMQQNKPQEGSQKKSSAGEKMKKMANMLQMSMQMSMQQQQMEDARTMRLLLENVLRSSLSQEELLISLSEIHRDDPGFNELVRRQNELTDNFTIVRDSLRALANRQPMIENFIFDELKSIDFRIEEALEQMNEFRVSQALASQQYAFMAMNNLALMIAESLENMENSMGMPSPMNAQGQPKPGESMGQKQMQEMRQMQEELGKMLEEMRKQSGKEQGQGKPGMSEQMARMAAQQEAIRERMQQFLNGLQAEGRLEETELKEIISEMEKLEEDLVNKRLNQRLIERQNEIVSRMLESEKSEQKREQEEKRESKEFKDDNFGNFTDEIEYKRILKEQTDMIRLNPLELRPYYRSKNNEYFFRRNARSNSKTGY
ncbi:MAG: hypothetical protein KJ578_06225 [Bacteroidetes bacterium]|nr:hypothetical protein [Bacteroidota bacterium]MBU1578342.1 hypothetical protein [Bacteroidota bacterium]MBU2557357.1 hypothetical protein [Bacteroidota bacterium]